MKKTLIIILGPTAVGKTGLSINIAKQINTSIISCDSRQFYKELKIGTAPPDKNQLKSVKHYLIGNKSIHNYYNVFQFEHDALSALKSIFNTSDYALMTGGSGMYIDVICKGIDDIPDIDEQLRSELTEKYNIEGIESLRFDLKRLDPEYFKKVDLKNKNRMLRAIEVSIQTGKPYSTFRKNKKAIRDFDIIKIGLYRERAELYNRINRRVDKMFEQGLLDEAGELFKHKHLNALNTVGYKELFDYFEGNISFEKAVELIKRNSRRFAKRQITWFKRDKDIVWFKAEDENLIIEYIDKEINEKSK